MEDRPRRAPTRSHRLVTIDVRAQSSSWNEPVSEAQELLSGDSLRLCRSGHILSTPVRPQNDLLVTFDANLAYRRAHN